MTYGNVITPSRLTHRARPCPLCQTAPGTPCQHKPPGDHLARYLDAYTAGQLTREYMAVVVSELVLLDACSVVREVSEPVTEPSEDEVGIRTYMACGDTFVDDVAYAEGDAMFCPRHGETRAITEEQWLAEHPPEPVGFVDETPDGAR